MKTVIAENPCVAREIASVLKASEKHDGYFKGNGYYVTWTLDHLVRLGLPEEYKVSGSGSSSQALLPNPFLLSVRKKKLKEGYKDDINAVKQLIVIDKLFRKSESIIVATDAGREGELIFRYIYEYLNCNKPFNRLWISSLTPKAIRNGFENLRSGKELDGLYQAAKARNQCDLLVDMNATRTLSKTYGNGIYSLGRVQTPTLGLICKRYLENKNFKTQQYWQIEMLHRHQYIDFKSISIEKWKSKKQAESILKAIDRGRYVLSVNASLTKTVTEQPPLLFDLTELQKHANRKLNLSADETLSIVQSLYERKFITYPRTGIKYISEDIWEQIPNLLRALKEKESCKKAVNSIDVIRLNKRIVNELQVNDHHGLLITEKIPSALSVKDNAVYDMIAFRLLESLSEVCIKEVSEVHLQVLYHDFSARGTKIVQPGWRTISGVFSENDNEMVQDLPQLKPGDEIKIKESVLLQKNTKPPVLYCEADLLSAMQNAGNNIQDIEQQKILQNIGIGTPATRAAIIEMLITRNYIRRKNKALLPTEKGLNIYQMVKDMRIANVSMTAEWENSMQKIEKGEMKMCAFHREMEKYITALTKELLFMPLLQNNLPPLLCPRCKNKDLVISDMMITCPDIDCGWVHFRNICGVQISLSDIESLFNNQKTSLIKGMKAKSGKQFNAFILLNDKGESFFKFDS